jgi:hypothetical protein
VIDAYSGGERGDADGGEGKAGLDKLVRIRATERAVADA